jgi:DNA-binding transcriptional MerR regulator
MPDPATWEVTVPDQRDQAGAPGPEGTANPIAPVAGGSQPEPVSQPEQGSLFAEEELRPIPEDLGYRGQTACRAAGISYRQLDYWTRTELIVPSVRPAAGSGTQRLYSFRDILILRVVKRLLDAGVSLQNVRAAVHHLADRGVNDLAQITLMSDGSSIYDCRSTDEIYDLLRGGQGVFGIALGQVYQEVESTLSDQPAVSIEGKQVLPEGAVDELASRRQQRKTG